MKLWREHGDVSYSVGKKLSTRLTVKSRGNWLQLSNSVSHLPSTNTEELFSRYTTENGNCTHLRAKFLSMSETDAAKLKERGNEAYRSGDYQAALCLFTSAIELDSKNETLYCNRSMCYAAQLDWTSSAADAKASIALSEKYVKAHFRLVKSQLELSSYREARLNLLNAFRLCGETKELKNLEGEILSKTKIPLRPKSTDFEVVDDLGEGNFSKIFKVSLKSTGDIYAMKVRRTLRLFILPSCLSINIFACL